MNLATEWDETNEHTYNSTLYSNDEAYIEENAVQNLYSNEEEKQYYNANEDDNYNEYYYSEEVKEEGDGSNGTETEQVPLEEWTPYDDGEGRTFYYNNYTGEVSINETHTANT